MRRTRAGVPVAFAAVLLSACGALPPLPPLPDVDAMPFVVEITADGWANIRVPICEGDRNVFVGPFEYRDGAEESWYFGWSGAATTTVIASFDVNPDTLAHGNVTSDIPLRYSEPWSSVPTSIDDLEGVVVASRRGYVEVHFDEHDWKPGESWTYHPTFAKTDPLFSPPGVYEPYSASDEELLRGVCDSARA